MKKYFVDFQIKSICEDEDYHEHHETHDLICGPETLEHEISKIEVGIRRRFKDEKGHLEVCAVIKDVREEPME